MDRRFVETFGDFLKHVANVDDESAGNWIDLNPLVIDVLSLQTFVRDCQHCQKTVIAVLAQRLGFPIFGWSFGIVQQKHQSIVVLGEGLGEVLSLKT